MMAIKTFFKFSLSSLVKGLQAFPRGLAARDIKPHNDEFPDPLIRDRHRERRNVRT